MKNFVLVLIGALIGAAIVYFICCKSTIMNNETMEPKGIITPAQAKTLDAAFNTRHQLISDSIVKRPDNRSSWYSIEDLRSYLSIAEKQAGELGYKMDGVRIYLGAHPDAGSEVGYTTMFFMPTGYQATAEGNLNPLNLLPPSGHNDIPGGKGLDMGGHGDPPSANYPQ